MSKYRRGVMSVEAITFDKLVEYGLQNAGDHIHNRMPWSFEYKGRRITHEKDDWYLVEIKTLKKVFVHFQIAKEIYIYKIENIDKLREKFKLSKL